MNGILEQREEDKPEQQNNIAGSIRRAQPERVRARSAGRCQCAKEERIAKNCSLTRKAPCKCFGTEDLLCEPVASAVPALTGATISGRYPPSL